MLNFEVNCFYLYFILFLIVCNKMIGVYIVQLFFLKYFVIVSIILIWLVYIKYVLIQIWFYYCVLFEFIEGIGFIGLFVVFGYNIIDFLLRINVGGEGVVGVDGVV